METAKIESFQEIEITGASGKEVYIDSLHTPKEHVENFRLKYRLEGKQSIHTIEISPLIDIMQTAKSSIYLSAKIEVPLGYKLFILPEHKTDKSYSGEVFIKYTVPLS